MCVSCRNIISGGVILNNLAFCERSMKLSGFVLDDPSFNLRCGGILSLTTEVTDLNDLNETPTTWKYICKAWKYIFGLHFYNI